MLSRQKDHLVAADATKQRDVSKDVKIGRVCAAAVENISASTKYKQVTCLFDHVIMQTNTDSTVTQAEHTRLCCLQAVCKHRRRLGVEIWMILVYAMFSANPNPNPFKMFSGGDGI
jgi:hypothetical protein